MSICLPMSRGGEKNEKKKKDACDKQWRDSQQANGSGLWNRTEQIRALRTE